MEDDPAHGLLLVLTVLETLIYDDGKVVARSLLAREAVDVVFLDEEDALLVACEAVINLATADFIRKDRVRRCVPWSLLVNSTE